MRKLVAITLALTLASCGSEAVEDTGDVETGGEAAGEVLEGTISDDMEPLGELTATSPPAERTATTSVTTTSNGTTTTVETTVTSSNDDADAEAAPAPAPPEPPATPEQ